MRESPVEKVPPNKAFRPSTRDNSNYKWQEHGVVGALEIPSEPMLDLQAPYRPINSKAAREEAFEEALQLWEEKEFRTSFLEGAATVPVEMACCGLLTDNAKTMEAIALQMNRTWVREANRQLKHNGFRVDCFIFSWSNLSGGSNTNILLIRFHQVKPNNSS